jgi:hypothetical protein
MAEQNKTVEATVRSIRRATRKKYTAEEKVRIELEGLRVLSSAPGRSLTGRRGTWLKNAPIPCNTV